MKLTIPELALVILMGPSGSGKSTFARAHFKPTEVLSSDFCRGLVADDEGDQSATDDAFAVLRFIAARRLAAGRLTVIDATNVQPFARKPLVALAREYHCLPVAIVFDLPQRICQERNQQRPDRDFGPHVIRNQRQQLKRSLRGLRREGFRNIHILASPEDVAAATIEREPLWSNLKHAHGPFDIIGDVHGCYDELESLLEKLGYEQIEIEDSENGTHLHNRAFCHPDSRKAIFLGDLVDRGPRILETYQLARNMVNTGNALCVPGNHDTKLIRMLRGRNVQIRHGLEKTVAEIEALPEDIRDQFCAEMADFFYGLVSHYVLDDGKLVVAHAGMKENMQGRGSGKVREFALYGETTGETDEFGLPIRHNWAAEYRGRPTVVYGHTPTPEAEWLNSTINVDTGCVFGGKLTALRYPERELVSVPAANTYADPIRPLMAAEDTNLTAQQEFGDVLDIEDVLGKRRISTRLMTSITIREENSIAALEIMSRFAANPRWLIYLPPTMSPSKTSQEPGLLEHPAQAFAYYHDQGIGQVICQEKHMGSRMVVIVCRDEEAAQRRFGVVGEGIGICYTRTGRHFFSEPAMEAQLLEQIQSLLTQTGFWDEFDTDWVCLDCELMPWSAKAQELLKQQYAPVGAASRAALAEVGAALQQAADRGMEVEELKDHNRERATMAEQYVDAYRQYCWQVNSISDLKLAPFHILATEGVVHVTKDHLWHMENIAKYLDAQQADCIQATEYRLVDLGDPDSESQGIIWWQEMTERGGEGMVVKPFDFIARGKRGLAQPAVKCRGREYLRIIYGLEYTAQEHLERLRQRNLSVKRSLALREFALGIEALERFVSNMPLRRVHECVFGILALESEPVDPRL
ncbi:polynucleotide kinase-phosphatase [Candidatus Poribacteria bacterium]